MKYLKEIEFLEKAKQDSQTELDSDQSFQIARGYHLLAVAVGDYRFDNWDDLTPEERKKLEEFEWTLAQYSSDFNYKSIVLLLNSEETKKAVANITETTEMMKEAIKSLNRFRKVIGIATAAFTLGGAIISGNPIAIGKAITEAIVAIETDTNAKDKEDKA